MSLWEVNGEAFVYFECFNIKKNVFGVFPGKFPRRRTVQVFWRIFLWKSGKP